MRVNTIAKCPRNRAQILLTTETWREKRDLESVKIRKIRETPGQLLEHVRDRIVSDNNIDNSNGYQPKGSKNRL